MPCGRHISSPSGRPRRAHKTRWASLRPSAGTDWKGKGGRDSKAARLVVDDQVLPIGRLVALSSFYLAPSAIAVLAAEPQDAARPR